MIVEPTGVRLCVTEIASSSPSPPWMRQEGGCVRMWGFCPLTDRQRERERVMDLTQIRVDYTHPPCLQSALHNLKSSYASLSHFEDGGGCVCVCVHAFNIQGDRGSHVPSHEFPRTWKGGCTHSWSVRFSFKAFKKKKHWMFRQWKRSDIWRGVYLKTCTEIWPGSKRMQRYGNGSSKAGDFLEQLQPTAPHSSCNRCESPLLPVNHPQ